MLYTLALLKCAHVCVYADVCGSKDVGIEGRHAVWLYYGDVGSSA